MSDQRLGIEGFTEEERAEILSQIEEISKKNAISVSNDAFDFTPQKKGALFPILINILAILTITGVVFYADRVFQARSEAMSAEAQSYISAEGKLLEELKKESERQLGEKEEEINAIQNELARIDQEKEALESNMEERIKEKEAELQDALETAIAEERARLQALGASAEDVENQLAAFRAEQEAAYQREVDSFRRESQAALEAKQQELEEAKAMAEDILNQANREKEELLEESKQREEELKAGFDEQRESLEAETEAAKAQLQALAQAKQNEQLFLDQLTAGYDAIIDAIGNNDRARAEQELAAFRSLLTNSTASSLDAVLKRRPIDSYLAELLEDRIATIGGGSETTADTGLLDSARILMAARGAAQKGDEAFQEGRINDAAASWSKSLELLPLIGQAAESLNSLRQSARADRSREYLALSLESLEGGNREEALQQLNAAVLEAASSSEVTRQAAAEALRSYQDLGDRELQAARDRSEVLSSAASDLERQLEDSRARASELEKAVTALQESLGESRELTSEQEEELATLESAVAELAGQKQDLETGLKDASDKLLEAENRLTEAQDELRKLETEMERALSTEAEKREELENELSASKAAVESLGKDIAEQRQELFSARASLTRAQEEVQSLQGDLDEAVEQLAALVNLSESDRTLRNAVRRYQSIGGSAVTSPEEADKRLTDLLQSNEVVSLFPGIDTLLDKSSLAPRSQ